MMIVLINMLLNTSPQPPNHGGQEFSKRDFQGQWNVRTPKRKISLPKEEMKNANGTSLKRNKGWTPSPNKSQDHTRVTLV
jgi:hypothetical protein